MVSSGLSSAAIAKMWLLPKDGFKAPIPNPDQKCLAQITRDFHALQLHPGHHQIMLSQRFLDLIDRSLSWDVLASASTIPEYIVSSKGACVELSLKKWCGDVLLNAATEAFFGKSLLAAAPDVFRSFFAFDDDSWMLLYNYPRFLARDMYRGKDASVDALTKYFELPKEFREDRAFFVRTLEQGLRDLDIDDRDIAKTFLMMYWV